jgi:benzoate-CoA ligase
MSVADNCNASLMVDRNIEAGRGSKTAYVAQAESLTYEELRRQVNRMGHLLRNLGVRREQRVLLVLDDTTAFPIAFLGALRIGAVPVPVSVREKADNFRHFIQDSYAEVVVCDAEILPALQSALTGHDVRYVARGAGEGASELDSALAAQEHELAPVATHPDDMAFWLYTSGSTGKPKGVVHLHHSIEVTCETFGRQVLAIREQDRIFSTTKLYHAYGLGNSLSFPLYFGATAVLLDGAPTPEQLLHTLGEHPPTVYFSVPALYKQLVADPDAGGAFSSVRLCISAAEPLPLGTFDQWRDRFGLEIVDGIGSTEMLQAYCSNRPGEVVPGTTGRPVPGYELRLTDEAGNELEGATVGTLEVRGDSCAAYYWHRHEQTRRSMRGEWFVSGDRFRRCADGRYAYEGRTDDMLKVGGLWVSPVDIEQVLLEHPAVASVGVVGVTIDDYTRVAAFVKCRDEVSGDDQLKGELRSWCTERMREHEYPHVIRFVDELPQTLTGKPQRFKLREMIERELTPSIEASPLQQAELAGLGDQGETRTPPTRFRGLVRSPVEWTPDDATGSLAQKLRGLREADRDEAVVELVSSHVAAVLGSSSAEVINTQRSFKELGFDSLAAVELRNRLGKATGLRLPSTLIFDHPTPEAVARLVRSRIEGGEPGVRGLDEVRGQADEPRAIAGTTEQTSDLAAALETIRRQSVPPRMPHASLAIRAKTSPWVRSLLPTRVLVNRAARRGRAIWDRSASEREDAIAGMATIIAGTSRAHELRELAQLHLIESLIDRVLFWQQPWSAKVDPRSAARLQEALAGGRGVLLSCCHLGPYYRLQCAPPFKGRDAYLVPGPWFFEAPSRNYWGRRLARWRKGTKSRLVPADGSFSIIQALLERGDPVFLFFDMPGQRETRFLGKSAMLAAGSAQLAVRANALVLPVRARRVGNHVWIDVDAPLDPQEFAGVDELHDALAALHERWILESPAAMQDPRSTGWEHGATAQAWIRP